MAAELSAPTGSSIRPARPARWIVALVALPLCLVMLPAKAGANMVVGSAPGVGGTNVDFYEIGGLEKFRDLIEIRQDLGPNSLTFEITDGETVLNFEGDEPCTGGFGAQTMTCTFPSQVVRLDVDTGEQNDGVVSTAPVNTFWDGGPGRDRLSGGPAADVMQGGTTAPPAGTTFQDDTLHGGPGPDELYGQIGGDTLNGGPGADLVDGYNGDDELTGEAGPDLLFGGDGSDVLSGGDGRDEFNGGAGSDVATYVGRSTPTEISIDGLPNDGGTVDENGDNVRNDIERLMAGDGDDLLTPAAAGSQIEGRGGNDVMTGGPGGDHFDGGEGNDRIALGEGRNTVDGGEGNDVIAGGTSSELLLGGGGDDVLLGAAGGDTVQGQAGDDHLDGGTGADPMSGGEGTDTVTYAQRANPVVVTIDDVANDGGPEDSNGDQVPSDVETVIGGAGNDAIGGAGGNELIKGGAGNDAIGGAGGNDRLHGEAGNDALVGGPGSDQLFGLGGADVLNARDGATDARIDCGAGVDRALTDTSDPPTTGCESTPPPPPPPGAAPLGKVAGKEVPVKRGTARPKLKCPAAATTTCAGRIVLKARKKKPGGGKKRIVLGKAGYEVEPGTKQRIDVAIKKKGRKLLARKRRTKGKASLIGRQTLTKKVTFIRKR